MNSSKTFKFFEINKPEMLECEGYDWCPNAEYLSKGHAIRAQRDEDQRMMEGRSRRQPNEHFSYISSWVKYSMFAFNFVFWMFGAVLIGIGGYAAVENWKQGQGFRLENVFDVIFNLAFLLVILGGVVFIVSFAGCIGALRENMCLLRFYSLTLLVFFLVEMALAALGFIFPNKLTNFLETKFSDELISNYRDDLDFQHVVDLVQTEFECCGISSLGYRDWSKNIYFNCTDDNLSVFRCGVPSSCCKESYRMESGLIKIRCGFELQDQTKYNDAEVNGKINTGGCMIRLRAFVENNLYVVAGIALGAAVAQLLVIWLGRKLEGQIEDQKSLWLPNR